MWPSVDTATRLYDLANWGLIAGLVVGVVSTVLLVWMGNVKEAYLRKDVAGAQLSAGQASLKIAELNVQAEGLRADAEKSRADIVGAQMESAKANAEAAKANERTQSLEKETAIARERQANAELLLSEVSKRQGPRRLDIQKFRQAMAGKLKGRCQIVYWPNDREAIAFAQQFQRWLGPGVDGDGAGWEVSDPTPMISDMTLPNLPTNFSIGDAKPVHLESSGVSAILPVSFNGKDDTPTGALVMGLLQAGIGNVLNRVDNSLPKDSAIIVVGPKP